MRAELSPPVPIPACVMVPQGGHSLQPVLCSMWVWCPRPKAAGKSFPTGTPLLAGSGLPYSRPLLGGDSSPTDFAWGYVGTSWGPYALEGGRQCLPASAAGLPSIVGTSAPQTLGLPLPHRPGTRKGSKEGQ